MTKPLSLAKAFLADVCAHPEDDAPRLVYADWLSDNGDPDRAEFIRAQCELARKRLPGGSARRRELTRRVKELFQAHGGDWAKAYGAWCSDGLENWARGFPERVAPSCSLADFARDLPGIVATAPVRSVFLSVRGVGSGEGAALAGCPPLVRLRGLELYGSVGGGTAARDRERIREELRTLLRSPSVLQLHKFGSIQLCLDTDALAPLLAAGRLEELHLYSNGLDDDTTKAICRSPCTATLTYLWLGEECTAKSARLVAQTPALAGLRTLDFDQCRLGDAGVKHLAGAAHLSGLRCLRLYWCGVGNAGAAALAASPYLTKLRELVLARNRVIYAGARALAASTTLPRGLDLDLWENELDDYTPEIRRALSKRFRRVNYGRSC
jgi:uncharacterized protein (TIGR02996 family)